MKYKELGEGTVYRSFKHIADETTIGVTIEKYRRYSVGYITIGVDSDMVVLKKVKLDTVPEVKAWACREIRRLINDLGKWLES